MRARLCVRKCVRARRECVCVCVHEYGRGKKRNKTKQPLALSVQSDGCGGSVVVGGDGGEEEWQCTRVAISGNVFSAAAYAHTSRARDADSTSCGVRVNCIALPAALYSVAAVRTWQPLLLSWGCVFRRWWPAARWLAAVARLRHSTTSERRRPRGGSRRGPQYYGGRLCRSVAQRPVAGRCRIAVVITYHRAPQRCSKLGSFFRVPIVR